MHSPLPEPPTVAPVEEVAQGEGTAAENAQQTGTQDIPQDTPPATPQDISHDAAEGTAQETPQLEQTQDDTAKELGQEEGEKKRKWSQEELLNLSRKFNLDLAPKVSQTMHLLK